MIGISLIGRTKCDGISERAQRRGLSQHNYTHYNARWFAVFAYTKIYFTAYADVNDSYTHSGMTVFSPCSQLLHRPIGRYRRSRHSKSLTSLKSDSHLQYDMNPGPSAPESSIVINSHFKFRTRLPSHRETDSKCLVSRLKNFVDQ